MRKRENWTLSLDKVHIYKVVNYLFIMVYESKLASKYCIEKNTDLLSIHSIQETKMENRSWYSQQGKLEHLIFENMHSVNQNYAKVIELVFAVFSSIPLKYMQKGKVKCDIAKLDKELFLLYYTKMLKKIKIIPGMFLQHNSDITSGCHYFLNNLS